MRSGFSSKPRHAHSKPLTRSTGFQSTYRCQRSFQPILRELAIVGSNEEVWAVKLSEIMSPVSTYFDPDTSLHVVVDTLARNRHSCGLVCENEAPVGIITERDIVRLFATRFGEAGIKDLPIKDLMSADPICVEADTELADSLETAQSLGLRHLPIVDSAGKLVGIVTVTDLVKANMATLEQNQALLDLNQRLHALAVEDPLTGLPNRRAMEVDISQAAAVAQRTAEPFSVALCDLDYFKSFNDHYGHPAGDEALIHVARTLEAKKRDSDRLYRYGGEEFLLLLPATNNDGAMIAAQRLGMSICESRYTHGESPLGVLTISIGVATGHGQDWHEVVELADAALYDAKEMGRNTVCKAKNAAVTVEHSARGVSSAGENQRPLPS